MKSEGRCLSFSFGKKFRGLYKIGEEYFSFGKTKVGEKPKNHLDERPRSLDERSKLPENVRTYFARMDLNL
jgi:hypothetical protein